MGLDFLFGIAVATIAILIFGEIIPKNLAKGPQRTAVQITLWLVNIIFYLFYPMVTFLKSFYQLCIIAKLAATKRLKAASEWVSSEREIQFLIDYIYGKGSY